MQRAVSTLTTTLRAGLITFLAFLVVAVFPAEAQKKKKGKSRTFEDQTSVIVVEIPVTVTTKDGSPVPDLSREDFEVLDGKKPQEIVSFEVIDLNQIEGETLGNAKPIPIAARRHFLMFFDMAYADPESLVKARQSGMDVLEELHPTDLVGVAIYTSTRGTNFILNFTSDRNQARLAIETLGLPKLIQRSGDPLNITLGQLSEGFGVSGQEGAGQIGDAVSQIVASEAAAIEANFAQAEVNERRQKVRDMTRNMEAAANVLASIEGQKHVLYFSEGIPDELIVGRGGLGGGPADGGGIGSADISDSNVGSNTGAEGTLGRLNSLGGATGDTRTQNALSTMVEAFNRAGATIQAIDIGGVRAANDQQGRAGGKQALTMMAKDTGGEIYDNFNNLSAAMGHMLESTSVTYLLAIQPAKLKADGEYHKLRVRLKSGERGMRISHRAGFYAPRSDQQVAPMERQLKTAEKILDGQELHDFDAAVLATVVPVKDEPAYVPLLIEVDGQSLLAGVDTEAVNIEIYAYALDDKGSVFDFATQTLGLDLAQVRGQLEASGLKYWGHLDLPAGEYTLRVMVRNSSNDRFALRRVPLTVPSAETKEANLWPPMIAEPQGKWLMAREGQDQQRDVPFPFMTGEGTPYIPAAKPVVPPKGSTPVNLQSFNMGEGDLEIIGEVRTADGEPAGKAKFKVDSSKAWKGGIHTGAGTLVTSGLSPGEYILLLSASGEDGTEHSSSIAFVVGP